MGGFRTEQSTKKIMWGCVLVAIVLLVGIAVYLIGGLSPYRQLKRGGYTGSQEQWLASLVGETADSSVTRAYELACQNGYKDDFESWSNILLGMSATDHSASMYSLACENGYQGTLQEWLLSISEKPDKLGRSGRTQPQTEYELACIFGYEGTFIEWLVSVTYERISN